MTPKEKILELFKDHRRFGVSNKTLVDKTLSLLGKEHGFCPKCGSQYEKGDCWKFRCSNKACGHTPKHLG